MFAGARCALENSNFRWKMKKRPSTCSSTILFWDWRKREVLTAWTVTKVAESSQCFSN
jgi:hypothetical protein